MPTPWGLTLAKLAQLRAAARHCACAAERTHDHTERSAGLGWLVHMNALLRGEGGAMHARLLR